MTDHQIEANFIFAILGISIPVVGFLVAVVLTLRTKRKRKAIIEELTNPKNRKNGKH